MASVSQETFLFEKFSKLGANRSFRPLVDAGQRPRRTSRTNRKNSVASHCIGISGYSAQAACVQQNYCYINRSTQTPIFQIADYGISGILKKSLQHSKKTYNNNTSKGIYYPFYARNSTYIFILIAIMI